MVRPKSFIPEKEITISPKSLISVINRSIIEIVKDITSPYNIEIPENTIKKMFENNMKLSLNWQCILSAKRCMYLYTDNSRKCFTLCNAKIQRDTSIDDPMNKGENKFFCYDHVKGCIPSFRKRKYKDPNITYCVKYNKKGNPCSNTAILVGNICREHYKLQNGIPKYEKITIPKSLYIKNFSIDFSQSYWHEYQTSCNDFVNYIHNDYVKTYEDYDNFSYKFYIENKKEKIEVEKNNYSNFSNFSNPGHLTCFKNNQEEIKDPKIENNSIDCVLSISDISLEGRLNKFNDKILNFNNKFKSITSYIKDIYEENISFKKDEKKDNEIMSEWEVSSLEEVTDIIKKYRSHICQIHPDDIEQDLYDNIYNQIYDETIQDICNKYNFKNINEMDNFINKYSVHICDDIKEKIIYKDSFNGKKINIENLKEYYNKLYNMENYIKSNKKILYNYKNKKCRSFYYNENDIRYLLEELNILYENVYDDIMGRFNKDILEQYKKEMDESIIAFYNIDDKYKLFV